MSRWENSYLWFTTRRAKPEAEAGKPRRNGRFGEAVGRSRGIRLHRMSSPERAPATIDRGAIVARVEPDEPHAALTSPRSTASGTVRQEAGSSPRTYSLLG